MGNVLATALEGDRDAARLQEDRIRDDLREAHRIDMRRLNLYGYWLRVCGYGALCVTAIVCTLARPSGLGAVGMGVAVALMLSAGEVMSWGTVRRDREFVDMAGEALRLSKKYGCRAVCAVCNRLYGTTLVQWSGHAHREDTGRAQRYAGGRGSEACHMFCDTCAATLKLGEGRMDGDLRAALVCVRVVHVGDAQPHPPTPTPTPTQQSQRPKAAAAAAAAPPQPPQPPRPQPRPQASAPMVRHADPRPAAGRDDDEVLQPLPKRSAPGGTKR